MVGRCASGDATEPVSTLVLVACQPPGRAWRGVPKTVTTEHGYAIAVHLDCPDGVPLFGALSRWQNLDLAWNAADKDQSRGSLHIGKKHDIVGRRFKSCGGARHRGLVTFRLKHAAKSITPKVCASRCRHFIADEQTSPCDEASTHAMH
jgi:hypothetical protein